MMSTLERLCYESNSLLREVESRLVQYEKVSQDFVDNVEAEIQQAFSQLTANLERMDIYANKEPISRRQNSKLSVEQIRYDYQHIQASFRGLQNRRAARVREQREREELLKTDFTKGQSGHMSIFVDADLRHQTSLRNVHRNMDDMINHGQEILGNLRLQGSSLKNVKSRILDIANKLGLSTTLMRMIERRGSQDRYFFYGGIIFTLSVMVFIYYLLA